MKVPTRPTRGGQAIFSAVRALATAIFFVLLMLCFVLYQYGPSYHLTLGSFGLLLVVIANFSSLRKSSLGLAFLVVIAMTISHMMFIARYQDDPGLLRMFRFSFNAFVLFLLVGNSGAAVHPNRLLISLVSVLLCLLAGYQYFFDLTFRLPGEWLALGDDLVAKSNEIFYGMSRRVAGIYSEPSAFAMIFCCLLAFGLRMDSHFKALTVTASTVGILLTGSLLGAFGLFALFAAAVFEKRIKVRKALIPAVLLIVLVAIIVRVGVFEFAVLNRFYEAGSMLDGSSMTRLVWPFLLIGKIFAEFNFFGYPGDIYAHFLGSGIYSSLGDFPGHNGILLLVMNYGLFGVAFMLALLRKMRSADEVVLLFVIGSQSGNFLSYEKVFIFLFVIFVLRRPSDSQVSGLDGKLSVSRIRAGA